MFLYMKRVSLMKYIFSLKQHYFDEHWYKSNLVKSIMVHNVARSQFALSYIYYISKWISICFFCMCLHCIQIFRGLRLVNNYKFVISFILGCLESIYVFTQKIAFLYFFFTCILYFYYILTNNTGKLIDQNNSGFDCVVLV